MKNAAALFALALAVFVGGCHTTKTEPSRGTFAFTYENDRYLITSIVLPSVDGYNYLTMSKEAQVMLRAKDHNQDGTLDTLLLGTITLADANHIYAEGIALAQTQGKYREEISTRSFEMKRGGYRYIIQTSERAPDSAFNRFIIYAPSTLNMSVLLDEDADGLLDSVESGAMGLEEGQVLYEKVLEEGVGQRKITLQENHYTVNPGVGGLPAL